MDTKDQASPGIVAGVTPLETELQLEGTGSQPNTPPEKQKSATPLQESFRRLRRDKRAMISIILILFYVLLPIFGPLIYPHIGGPQDNNGLTMGPDKYHSPYFQDFNHQDEGPSGMHWLGTDSLGRDLLARLMEGLLVSIVVAVSVEIVNVSVGMLIGVLAGYYGGWIDQLLARFTDIMFAFPGLLFAILLAGILGGVADDFFGRIPVIGANGHARLILVGLALAVAGWPITARFARGQTLQLREQQFIEAARTSGTTNAQIILRHIVPNLISIIVVTTTLDISGIIIGEAGLSFLGLGVAPPGSSLGLMINDGLATTDTHPWEVLLPSIVLTLLILALSFLGDGLRDAFDPRSKD